MNLALQELVHRLVFDAPAAGKAHRLAALVDEEIAPAIPVVRLAHDAQHPLDGAVSVVFNGKDGEWRAELALYGKKVSLELREQTREQPGPRDLHYLFAPLKHERLDYMMQKAVEMGVTRLVPVLTQHTQVNRVNTERMRANAIEAAEQCGVLTVPEIGEPLSLARVLAARKPERLLVFCDEDADVSAHVRRSRQRLVQKHREETQRRQACNMIVRGQALLARLNPDPFVERPEP